MKKKLCLAMLAAVIVLGSVVHAFSQASRNGDVEDVKQAVVQGYVDGVFLKTDMALIEKYWHADCDIYQYRDGKLVKVPAVASFREAGKRIQKPYDATVTYKFVDVRVKDYAAIAIVEINSHGAYRYTDFLNLYKFDDGWKIVTKTYHHGAH